MISYSRSSEDSVEEVKLTAEQIRELVKRAREEGRRILQETPSQKPEPEGVCVICKTLTVQAKISRELIPGAIPIIGPGSQNQYHSILRGYYCTTCGVSYEFPTKP